MKHFFQKQRINKQGITPLMITFLLISFAVAVGVVVMNFGRAQVEEEAQCAVDINLVFAQISGKEDICYDATTKQLRFTIENGVNVKVEGLLVNIVGTEKAESKELSDAMMPKGGTYLGKVPFDVALGGTIRQVKIVPKIVPFDEEQICTEKALIAEAIGNC